MKVYIHLDQHVRLERMIRFSSPKWLQSRTSTDYLDPALVGDTEILWSTSTSWELRFYYKHFLRYIF